MKGAIQLAESIVASNPDQYFMPQQFHNPANPLAHELTTGPEVAVRPLLIFNVCEYCADVQSGGRGNEGGGGGRAPDALNGWGGGSGNGASPKYSVRTGIGSQNSGSGRKFHGNC